MSIRGYIRRLERANITDLFGIEEPLGKIAGPLLGITQGGTRLYKELHTHNAIETVQRKNPVTTDRTRIVTPHRHVKHKPDGRGVPMIEPQQHHTPGPEKSREETQAPKGGGSGGGPTVIPTLPNAPAGTIAWGKKVSPAFKSKVVAMAKMLNTDPNWLMAVMAFESGESFRPDIRNAAGSGATGLIQFMPATARGMGTTTQKLASMTAEEQLDWVYKYFKPYKAKLNSLEDVYMAVLYPRAAGKSQEYTLFSSGKAYSQNRGLDANKDGRITKAEAAGKVREKLMKGLKPQYVG